MYQITGITDFQRNIRKNLDLVVNQKVDIILTRDSKPQAVLSSYEEYQKIKAAERQLAREYFLKIIASIRNRNKNIREEELIEDLEMTRNLKRKNAQNSR